MFTESFLKGLQAEIRLKDETEYIGSEIVLTKEWDGNIMRSCLANNSVAPVFIKEIALFSGIFPVEADTEFYAEGYNMLTQYGGTLSAPHHIGNYGTDGEFFRFPKTKYTKDLYTTYNMMVLSPGKTEHILMAFTSCNKFMGEFRIKDNYIEIVMDTENIELSPGESWQLEEFIIMTGSCMNTLLDSLADRLNINHPPIKYHEIPSGWCSFYCLRPMTAAGLVQNAYAMAKRIPELKRIQIDGGYEIHDGDWLTARPSLGADMKSICEAIRAAGVEAAGYISPFLVETESNLYKEHADWTVCGEDGKPFNDIGHKENWYMLDGSNPCSQSYLRHLAKVMHDDWGIRYFKLDFLSYGALPGGVRYDRKATRVESFRLAIKAIVNEVSHDSFILGCNAPFWPMLGLAHGNRATNDIARDWKHVRNNAYELFWRNWQNGKLWYNDPDVAVLEKLDLVNIRNGSIIPRECSLTDDEFEFHKAFIVASGGMILSGDLIYGLSDKNIAALRKLIQTTGTAAKFDDTSFKVGRIDKGEEMYICVFNWDEESADTEIELSGQYLIKDFWTEEVIAPSAEKISVNKLPGHGAHVFHCEKL